MNSTVRALAVKDNDLYVGGSFTSAGGVPERNNIAKWAIGGSDNSSWSALGSGRITSYNVCYTKLLRVT